MKYERTRMQYRVEVDSVGSGGEFEAVEEGLGCNRIRIYTSRPGCSAPPSGAGQNHAFADSHGQDRQPEEIRLSDRRQAGSTGADADKGA